MTYTEEENPMVRIAEALEKIAKSLKKIEEHLPVFEF
jgi:hypothetical protein